MGENAPQQDVTACVEKPLKTVQHTRFVGVTQENYEHGAIHTEMTAHRCPQIIEIRQVLVDNGVVEHWGTPQRHGRRADTVVSSHQNERVCEIIQLQQELRKVAQFRVEQR